MAQISKSKTKTDIAYIIEQIEALSQRETDEVKDKKEGEEQ